MKKALAIVVACAFVFGFVYLTHAQETKGDMQQKHMRRPMVGGDEEGPWGKMAHEKMRKMLPMMGPKAMVASNDGGVIVLIGDKLQKYDKDLNLVKEVTITGDKECPLPEEEAAEAKQTQEQADAVKE